MSTNLVKLDPEHVEIANTYLESFSIEQTALTLGISEHEVSEYLDKKPVQRYIDNVFMDTGYRNKHKLGRLLDKIVESKLEEADETGVYSGKDLLEVLKFIHEIAKPVKEGPSTQVNIQNNYKDLMESLLK